MEAMGVKDRDTGILEAGGMMSSVGAAPVLRVPLSPSPNSALSGLRTLPICTPPQRRDADESLATTSLAKPKTYPTQKTNVRPARRASDIGIHGAINPRVGPRRRSRTSYYIPLAVAEWHKYYV